MTLKIFDKTVWLWKRINPILPTGGALSLIVVARKGASPTLANTSRTRCDVSTACEARETACT